MLNLQASQLEPGNLIYRLNMANVLVEAERYQDAVRVLQAALSLAKNPREVAQVQNQLKEIQENQDVDDQATQPDHGAVAAGQANVITGKSDGIGPAAIKLPAPKHPAE